MSVDWPPVANSCGGVHSSVNQSQACTSICFTLDYCTSISFTLLLHPHKFHPRLLHPHIFHVLLLQPHIFHLIARSTSDECFAMQCALCIHFKMRSWGLVLFALSRIHCAMRIVLCEVCSVYGSSIARWCQYSLQYLVQRELCRG